MGGEENAKIGKATKGKQKVGKLTEDADLSDTDVPQQKVCPLSLKGNINPTSCKRRQQAREVCFTQQQERGRRGML